MYRYNRLSKDYCLAGSLRGLFYFTKIIIKFYPLLIVADRHIRYYRVGY